MSQASSYSDVSKYLNIPSQASETLVNKTEEEIEHTKLSPSVDRTITHYKIQDNLSFEESEQLLIRDILYAFHGVDGHYTLFNHKVLFFPNTLTNTTISGY